ncbi:MAG: DNA polymerase domain-containing protein [Nitrososphaerota archaeon]
MGWLLDLHISRSSSATLWVKDRHGHVTQHNVKWMPKLYVSGSHKRLEWLGGALADRYEVCATKKIVRPDSQPIRVLEISTPADEKIRLAKILYGLGGLEVYNVDLPPTQELLYHFNLHPTALIDLRDMRVLDSVEDIEYDTSVFTTAHLDISVEQEDFMPRFSDRLVSARLRLGDEVVVLDGGEEDILVGLEKMLDDVDILLTSGGDGFTLPYLHRRAAVNGLRIRLGRAAEPVHKPSSTTYLSYGRVYHRFRAFKLVGRVHIDTSNSLLYGETGFEGVVEVARTARVPLQDAARYTIGSCMTSLQYHQAYIHDILLPWKSGKPSYMTARHLAIADRGGWILDHIPGVYWNVAELDFQSLYPMLMLKHNISGETVNCRCCNGVDIPELGYHICRRWNGIVPRAIEIPLRKRLSYKRLYKETGLKIYKQRADALKWILVTSFGYLGFRKAKFGSREAHMTVCSLARETLMRSVETAEELGFHVIHGIVDCLWVVKDDASDEDYMGLAKAIEDRVGLPVSYEGRYRWIAFLPSKTHQGRPVNNRYFGIFTDGRIKYRGIELRRRDTPQLVKMAQMEMLEKLAQAHNPMELRAKAMECYEILRRYLERIYSGEVDVNELAITNSLSMKPQQYSHTPRYVTAVKRLLYRGFEIRPGQPITYIISAGEGPFRATPIQMVRGRYYSADIYAELLKSAFQTLINVYTFPTTTPAPDPDQASPQ